MIFRGDPKFPGGITLRFDLKRGGTKKKENAEKIEKSGVTKKNRKTRGDQKT